MYKEDEVKQKEFEALLSKEEGFQIWETAKTLGYYKYSSTAEKYKDFLAGVYPYKDDRSITEDRKVMIKHLRKQACELSNTAQILEKQADLLERGYEIDQIEPILRKELWWIYAKED